MNQITKTSLVAALLASASIGAFAADTADLTVKGVIKPAACNVSLSGGATIDFGTIPANTLSDTAFTNLGTKSIDLTISCDAPTKVGLAASDGRAGTSVPGIGGFLYTNQGDADTFGIGEIDGKKIGGYILFADTAPLTDSKTGNRVASSDQGATWSQSTNTSNAMTPTRLHAFADANTTVPGAFKTVQQTYKVSVAVNKTGALPTLSREIPIDGLATFTVKYL